MIVVGTRIELDEAIRPVGNPRQAPIGFVPTMGSLHEGHLALVRASVARGAVTVASLFVNPTQFGPGEDFDAYPRDEQRDASLLESAGCDVLFAPQASEVYPSGFATSVIVDPELTGVLCGGSRGNSHFDGVTTVVSRLFGLVRPDFACFGEKDWQQLRIVSRMAADIHPSITIIPCPTVRDPDGVAMSSRNAYMSRSERTQAAAIPAALGLVSESIATEGTSASDALTSARALLTGAGLEVEYLEIRHADDLTPCDTPLQDVGSDGVGHSPRVFVAARIGRTRLIDNSPLFPVGAVQAASMQTASEAATAHSAASTN